MPCADGAAPPHPWAESDRSNESVSARCPTKRRCDPALSGSNVASSMALDLEPLRVGAAAPGFTLRAARGDILAVSGLEGQPTVLAFAESWEPPSAEDLEAIRAELRALGAFLLVVSKTIVLGFRPDDDRELVESSDEVLRRDVASVAHRYGVADPSGVITPALLVIDRDGI